jgi:hypothetical protein
MQGVRLGDRRHENGTRLAGAHDAQQGALRGGCAGQFGQPVVRDGPGTVGAAVAAPPHDLRHGLEVGVGGRAVGDLEGRHVLGPVRVGQPIGGCEGAERGQGHPQVMQHRAAADQQVALIRVGGGQPACGVGEQLQRPGSDPEPPRLGVVQRRRAHRQFQRGQRRFPIEDAGHDRLPATRGPRRPDSSTTTPAAAMTGCSQLNVRITASCTTIHPTNRLPAIIAITPAGPASTGRRCDRARVRVPLIRLTIPGREPSDQGPWDAAACAEGPGLRSRAAECG